MRYTNESTTRAGEANEQMNQSNHLNQPTGLNLTVCLLDDHPGGV
jgi:hypothetical protein